MSTATIKAAEKATTTKVLKGKALFVETDTGSHYYAFSPVLSTSRYKEVMANIVLPTQLELKGTGSEVKYAYISLGIGGPLGAGDAVDLGICNHGSGWYPVYNDVQKPTEPKGEHFTDYLVKDGVASNAIIVVKPIDSTHVGLYVEFRNAAGATVGKVFDQSIQVTKTNWSRYYRFASLLGFDDNTMDDSTYMIGGKFTSLQIYDGTARKYLPWGIYTNYISNAWIVGFNKCQVLDITSTSETFRIDNWAD